MEVIPAVIRAEEETQEVIRAVEAIPAETQAAAMVVAVMPADFFPRLHVFSLRIPLLYNPEAPRL